MLLRPAPRYNHCPQRASDARLENQRGIDDHDRVRVACPVFACEFPHARDDGRMEKGVELTQLFRLRKHPGAEFFAVDDAGGIEDLFPEALKDFREAEPGSRLPSTASRQLPRR